MAKNKGFMYTANDWHLDKRVPVAFLLVLLAHTMAAIWYASALNSRVGALEVNRQNAITAYERLIRLETKFEVFEQSLFRIDKNLEKLTDRVVK